MSAGDQNDLEWLVDRRSKIQQLLLDIYSLDSKPSRSMAFQLLVGVGFSLWRAAFLAEGEHASTKIQEHSRNFLKTLIIDNAINYAQDRSNFAWTFGYYVNSAYFRLSFFDEKIGLTPTHADKVAAFLNAQATSFDLSPEPHAAWDHAYEATKDALQRALGVE